MSDMNSPSEKDEQPPAGLSKGSESQNDKQRRNDSEPTTAPAVPEATNQPTEGDEINAFLKDIAAKRKRREFQLSMVKEFFEDPLKFGVRLDSIPTSSSPSEIAKRKHDLGYRRDLLRLLLESTEAELSLLKLAETETPKSEESGQSNNNVTE